MPYLVTPSQGTRFYEAAFQELQILERDMLSRGVWPEAVERIELLGREADELIEALGPSARSGDAQFGAALNKVEMVRSYLIRLRELPQVHAGPGEDTGSVQPGVLGRLSRMLKGDDSD